jgi:hypothetical protein
MPGASEKARRQRACSRSSHAGDRLMRYGEVEVHLRVKRAQDRLAQPRLFSMLVTPIKRSARAAVLRQVADGMLSNRPVGLRLPEGLA